MTDPGTKVTITIPDWLGRALMAEAREAAEAAEVDREIGIEDFVVGILVWRYLEKQPGFNEGLRKAEEELKERGFKKWEHGPSAQS